MAQASFPKKVILNLVIVFGVLSFLITALIIFNKNLERTANQTGKLNQELISRSSSIQRISELRTAYKGMSGAYLNVLYNVIPQKDELINLSKEMQTVAASEGLTFGFSFVGETPPAGESLGYVAFSLSLEGGQFQNIMNFVNKLENFRYFIQLENFDISSGGAKATVRGRIFFR